MALRGEGKRACDTSMIAQVLVQLTPHPLPPATNLCFLFHSHALRVHCFHAARPDTIRGPPIHLCFRASASGGGAGAAVAEVGVALKRALQQRLDRALDLHQQVDLRKGTRRGRCLVTILIWLLYCVMLLTCQSRKGGTDCGS